MGYGSLIITAGNLPETKQGHHGSDNQRHTIKPTVDKEVEMTGILLAIVGLIVLAIIMPKPGQLHRGERIQYLLDRAEDRRDNQT